jgi:hypothetical protein
MQTYCSGYFAIITATVEVLVLHSLIMHNSRIASTLGGDQLRPSQKPLHVAYCIMHGIGEVIMHYEHMSYQAGSCDSKTPEQQ